jgi:hypothetical protein
VPAGIGKKRNKGDGMIRQQIRVALLAGSLAAATALTARAGDCCQPAPAAPAAPCPAAPAAPCPPQYRTVCEKVWVPETYQTTRTVYERVCRPEKYTAYRCECFPVTQTRTVPVCRQVPEVKEVVRRVCVYVPCVETRTVMKTQWACVPETRVVRKCVQKGHYECKEVPCGPSCWERLAKLCHRRKGCCEEQCEQPCQVRTKTVKVWVPCPVYENRTVTCMKRVCQHIPVQCQVTVCKPQFREEKCQVTCYRTVTEMRTETVTCMQRRMVPYEATRTVVTCVPRQETVTCTRMVCRTVQKQVPVAAACAEAKPCCAESGCGRSRWFHRCGGLGFRAHGCCE